MVQSKSTKNKPDTNETNTPITTLSYGWMAIAIDIIGLFILGLPMSLIATIISIVGLQREEDKTPCTISLVVSIMLLLITAAVIF